MEKVYHHKSSQSNIFTKNCIVTAFFDLLKETSFDKITITDIINKAGVSRMGFYRNYQSKEDILEKFIAQCFDETIYTIKDVKSVLSITKIMELTLEYFQQYSEYMEILIKQNLHFLLFYSYEKAFYSLYGKMDGSRLRRYSVQMFIGELFLLEIEWVRSGMIETPAQMAKIYHKILQLRLRPNITDIK